MSLAVLESHCVYILAMMSNVIYFNLFTIKPEMDGPVWHVLCQGGVGVGAGQGQGVGAVWEDWGLGELRTVGGSH